MNSTIGATIQSVDLLAQEPGAYRYNNNCSNKPSTETGYMQLTQRDSTTKVATAVTNSGKMFTNVMSGGTWAGWQELALKSEIAISNSTVNINSYTGNVNASVNRVFKSNGIIHLSLVVSTTNDFKFPSSTTLFTIPDGYRPASEINVPAILQVGETRMQYFVTINTSGQIRQNLSSNTTSVLIDTTFVQ